MENNKTYQYLYHSPDFPGRDNLKLHFQNEIITLLEPGEMIIYSGLVQKFNKKAISQTRTLIITTKHVISMRLDTAARFINFFSSGYKVRMKAQITHIESIIYSKNSKEFVLVIPKQYDLNLSSKDRDDILSSIF